MWWLIWVPTVFFPIQLFNSSCTRVNFESAMLTFFLYLSICFMAKRKLISQWLNEKTLRNHRLNCIIKQWHRNTWNEAVCEFCLPFLDKFLNEIHVKRKNVKSRWNKIHDNKKNQRYPWPLEYCWANGPIECLTYENDFN